MNKAISFCLTLVTVLLTVVSAGAQNHQYELHVGEYHKLQVIDNVNVVWVSNPDSTGYVRFYGAERFADAFILSNNGKGTLKVRVATEDVNEPDLPTLYIYSSYLTEIYSSSALTVSANDIPAAAKFKFKLIGNGHLRIGGIEASQVEAKIETGNGAITLRGKCTQANFSMMGTGQIRADELVADAVKCTILGTGAIFTHPVKTLNVRGLGSTKIYYTGDPEITKHGGGKLMPMTEAPTSQATSAQSGAAVQEEADDPDDEDDVEEAEEEEEEEEEEPLSIPERRN